MSLSHDLLQWIGLISGVLGVVWWLQRDSRNRKKVTTQETKWRTNLDRDIDELRKDIGTITTNQTETTGHLQDLKDELQKVDCRVARIEGSRSVKE